MKGSGLLPLELHHETKELQRITDRKQIGMNKGTLSRLPACVSHVQCRSVGPVAPLLFDKPVGTIKQWMSAQSPPPEVPAPCTAGTGDTVGSLDVPCRWGTLMTTPSTGCSPPLLFPYLGFSDPSGCLQKCHSPSPISPITPQWSLPEMPGPGTQVWHSHSLASSHQAMITTPSWFHYHPSPSL